MGYSSEEAERIAESWTGAQAGSCVVLDDVASTQDEVRSRIDSAGRLGPGSTLVVASRQRAGRGTRGRVWNQDSDGDISFSLSVPEAVVPEPLALPMIAGVAVLRAAKATLERSSEFGATAKVPSIDKSEDASERLRLKWPNDVLLAEKKLAGILIENYRADNEARGWIVGIGINVSRTRWPDELASIATSLRETTGRDFDRTAILCDVLRAWLELLEAVRSGHGAGLAALYEQGLGLIGKHVVVHARGADHAGILIGASASGVALDQDRSFAPGEVEAINRRRSSRE